MNEGLCDTQIIYFSVGYFVLQFQLLCLGWGGNKTTSPSFKLFQTSTSQAEKAFLHTARTICMKQSRVANGGQEPDGQGKWFRLGAARLRDLDRSTVSCS